MKGKNNICSNWFFFWYLHEEGDLKRVERIRISLYFKELEYLGFRFILHSPSEDNKTKHKYLITELKSMSTVSSSDDKVEAEKLFSTWCKGKQKKDILIAIGRAKKEIKRIEAIWEKKQIQ